MWIVLLGGNNLSIVVDWYGNSTSLKHLVVDHYTSRAHRSLGYDYFHLRLCPCSHGVRVDQDYDQNFVSSIHRYNLMDSKVSFQKPEETIFHFLVSLLPSHLQSFAFSDELDPASSSFHSLFFCIDSRTQL